VGIYDLESLAALLWPVREVTAVAATALPQRRAGEAGSYAARDPDTWQLVLRHEGGALSSVLASHATYAYRRPAIELYGTAGSANLPGDDWDPRGLEVWREGAHSWELREPDDATWLWTDGLREAVPRRLNTLPRMFSDVFPILLTRDMPRAIGFYRDLLEGEIE
jgi:predicted dehydrogenase